MFIYENCIGDENLKRDMYAVVGQKALYENVESGKGVLNALYNCIFNYKNSSEKERADSFNSISDVLAEYQKEELLIKPLKKMYVDKPHAYDYDFTDVTPIMLRERITTFNNLIVRLPVGSRHNCIASKHIFQDWKSFVDGAKNYLIGKGELFE